MSGTQLRLDPPRPWTSTTGADPSPESRTWISPTGSGQRSAWGIATPLWDHGKQVEPDWGGCASTSMNA